MPGAWTLLFDFMGGGFASTTPSVTVPASSVGDPLSLSESAAATSATTLTLPNFLSKEVWPHGAGYNPEDDWLRNQLQDAFNSIENQFNILIQEITNNTFTVGQGGLDNSCRVIGHSAAGIDLNSGSYTTLTNTAGLRLHPSGQLIIAWREYTGSGNLYTTYVKKAFPPYTVWTDLSGVSQDPTAISSAVPELNGRLCYVCNEETGELHFFFQNSSTTNITLLSFTYDGANFAEGASTVLSPTFNSGGIWFADAICTGGNLLLAIREDFTSEVTRIYRADATLPTTFTEVAFYRDIYYSGAITAMGTSGYDRQFVDLGDGRVMLLCEMRDSSARKNLVWMMSEDYGETWPVGDTSTNPTVYEIGYPGDATGTLFTQTSGGAWSSANMVHAGVSRTWAAAHIAGTSRVGLVYLAEYTAAAALAGAFSGVLYAEFNADTLEWTPQDEHFQLTPQNVSYDGSNYLGLMNRQGGPTVIPNSGGQAFAGNDGIPRALWVNGTRIGTGTNGEDIPLSVGYRRAASVEVDTTETNQWTSQKEVFHFYPLSGSDQVSPRFIQSEFEACRNGIVTIGTASYLPITWNRRLHSLTTAQAMAEWEICFKLLPVALMDLP